MNADAAFVTGKTHRVCQDYARADMEGKYVILSDGCSSSTDTDFGARLIVKSVENAIHDPKSADPTDLFTYAQPRLLPPLSGIANAVHAARVLQLSDYALDATLLMARYVESAIVLQTSGQDDVIAKGIEVTVYGDGFIAGRKRDGTVEGYKVEYASGYPQYPSYRLSVERQARLHELTNGNPPNLERWLLDKEPKQLKWDRGQPNDSYHCFYFPIRDYDLVAIFSDGAGSFTEGTNYIPWQTIVREMMDFGPAMKGEFIQRQMNWAVKEYVKRKWSHADDFTMGAINIGGIE